MRVSEPVRVNTDKDNKEPRIYHWYASPGAVPGNKALCGHKSRPNIRRISEQECKERMECIVCGELKRHL